jgi:selenoprotein W-related protein
MKDMAGEQVSVSITYCAPCNFAPRAAWMALELLQTFRDAISGLTLVPGRGGIFDVAIDGEVVFCRQALGRYPEPQEVREAIRERLDNPPQRAHAPRNAGV